MLSVNKSAPPAPAGCEAPPQKNPTPLLPFQTRISRQSGVVTSPSVFFNAGLFRHPTVACHLTVMMSEAAGQAAEHPGEDRVSLESNGKSPTKTLGKFGSSFRNSMRRVVEFSPLSPGGKGSKVTPKEAGSKPPPSPSEYHPGKSIKKKIVIICPSKVGRRGDRRWGLVSKTIYVTVVSQRRFKMSGQMISI